jgi:PleD family two-component response regulator
MDILIADDDHTTRILLKRTLEVWGHNVTAVDNGSDAWALVQSEPFNVVLTDWEMPGLDGPELCSKVRALQNRYVYMMLLTSHTNTEHIIEGLGAGADDFVAKPFEPLVLRARLTVAQRLLALQNELAMKNVELAGANLELAHANHELARIATTDPLLDIGNRRSFEDMVVHTHNAARRGRHPYGVVLADIDHFKHFNDRYGHSYGDKVLHEVAQTLKLSLAKSGTLFRYGGEELIAVVPNLSDFARQSKSWCCNYQPEFSVR